MTSAASVARFDAAFDAALEQLRGHPVSDRIFRTASALGDWSVIWELVGAAWGLTSDRRTDRALRLAVLLGVESLVVNQGIKRLFKRERPTLAGDPRLPVRTPVDQQLPERARQLGLLRGDAAERGRPRAGAALVRPGRRRGDVSRAYVRVHHASDIVAGAAVGLALAAVARRLWPQP